MKRFYKLYIYLIIIGLLLLIFGCITKTPAMSLKTYRGTFICSYDIIQYRDTIYTIIEDSWTPKLYSAKAYDKTGVYVFKTDYYSLRKYKIEYNNKLRRWQYTPHTMDVIIKR